MHIPFISFYPGPSQIHSQIKTIYEEAFEQNITGYNHRSSYFIEIIQNCRTHLFQKLNVPQDYQLGFLSSATEAWSCIANSFTNIPATFFYNGSFGEKWYQVHNSSNKNTSGIPFGINHTLPYSTLPNINQQIIGICQSETSNGSMVPNEILKDIRTQYPDALIAVDATSSMAGVELDFSNADIWFASVQKCFGLPAGLCVLIMSPRVIEYASTRNNPTNMYDLYDKASIFQTIHTPNTINIYALGALMAQSADISTTHKNTSLKARLWNNYLKENNLQTVCTNPETVSETVFCISYDSEKIDHLLKSCFNHGFMLGKGYGAWAKNTFRIANFPALEVEQIVALQKVLSTVL